MNFIRPFAALLAGVLLLCGCSREGFADSLSRETEPSSSQTEEKPTPVGAVYRLEDQSVTGVEGSFSVPVADSAEQEKAAKRIARSIRGSVSQMAEWLTTQELSNPVLTCEVTVNDGENFSLWFSLTAKSGEQQQQYGWGMILDSATGADVGINRLIEPQALSILLLDGPSVEILEADAAASEKQRAYLSEQGSDKLGERLLRSDSGDAQTLIDASCYLTDSRQLVAVFSAPQEIGGVVRASVLI